MRILNSAGGSFTNRHKALQYLSAGRARYIDEGTIEMIESDPRHQACIASTERPIGSGAHSPHLEIVARLPVSSCRVLIPLGYLHYPQRDQTTQKSCPRFFSGMRPGRKAA